MVVTFVNEDWQDFSSPSQKLSMIYGLKNLSDLICNAFSLALEHTSKTTTNRRLQDVQSSEEDKARQGRRGRQYVHYTKREIRGPHRFKATQGKFVNHTSFLQTSITEHITMMARLVNEMSKTWNSTAQVGGHSQLRIEIKQPQSGLRPQFMAHKDTMNICLSHYLKLGPRLP